MSEQTRDVLFLPRRVAKAGREELEASGVSVLALESEEELWNTLEDTKAKLLVLELGALEAKALCRKLRENPKGAVLPVLLLGTDCEDSVESIEGAIEVGGDAFLERGYGTGDLVDRIGVILGVETSMEQQLQKDALEKENGEPASAKDLVATDDPVEEALFIAGVSSEELNLEVDEKEKRYSIDEMSLSEIVSTVDVGQLEESRAVKEPESEEEAEGLETLEPEAYLDRPMSAVDEDSYPPRNIHEEPSPKTVAEKSDEPENIVAEPAEHTTAEPEPASPEIAEPQPRSAHKAETQREKGALHDSSMGRLEERPMWSLLAGFRATRSRGTLVLKGYGKERRIIIDEGEPVMALSSSSDDRLIELLYKEGRLSPRQYEQASTTIGATGRRAGAVLVEKGLISSRELFPLVRHHYEALIFDTFAWEEGAWRFIEEAEVKERILLDIPAATIITEGLRSRVSSERIRALVHFAAKPKILESGICPLEELSLTAGELEHLEWFDGRRTVEDLADRFRMPPGELAALLAALKVLGWVDASGTEDKSQGAVAPEASRVGERRQELRVERARVADKIAQVEEGSYFALLEVPQEASGYEIRKAYRRLKGIFSRERFAVEELADLRREVDDIGFVLDEAYEILRNPTLREAYRDSL